LFTSDAARIIGITPKALRSFLRERSRGVGSRSRYEFSYDEVMQLKDDYWKLQGHSSRSAKTTPWLGDGGRPPLPIKYIHDPDMQSKFVEERLLRIQRMNQRLHEVGLSVPQMSETILAVNCRAIAAALLKPKNEDQD